MGFPSQENWSGLPFPSPGELPYPGIEPRSPVLKAKKNQNKTAPSEPRLKPLFSLTLLLTVYEGSHCLRP